MSIQAFAEFLDSNPEIASKVAVASNYDEVSQIASANGFVVSGAELTRHAAIATSELSDEALEAVAGGAWTSTSGDIGIGAGMVGSAAAATGATIIQTVAATIIVK